MNSRNLQNGIWLCLAMILSGGMASGQVSGDKLIGIIIERDSLFWNDYNTCNTEDMRQYFVEGIEFYHDRGGPSVGLDPLINAVKNNICGNSTVKIRREAVKGTVKVFLMQNGDQYYGAIISGDHRFYRKEGSKPEELTGIAKFTHLWVLQNDSWKMSRVLSYDHHAVSAQSQQKEISLSSKELAEFAGNYLGEKSGMASIAEENGTLVMSIGGNKFSMYAAQKDHFFSKERDLLFDFLRDKQNKPYKLQVKEHGVLAEELVIKK